MRISIKYTVLLLSPFLFLPLAAQELMPDGSFEKSTPGKAPAHWHVDRAQGAESRVEVIGGGQGTQGANALRIISRSPARPHRFTQLSISLPLKPGERYRLQYKAKGKNVAGFNWSFGKSWKLRFRPAPVSEKFEPFFFDFSAAAEEFSNGKYLIQLLADDIADELVIDEISLVSLAPKVLERAEYLREKIWPLADAPEGWENQEGIPPGVPVIRFDAREGNYTGDSSKARLSGSFAAAFVPEGVAIWLEVNDPVIKVNRGSSMWSADSVQLRIDRAGKRLDTEVPTDLELGFAPQVGAMESWCWQLNRPLAADECRIAGGLTKNGYRFRGVLSWKLLDGVRPDGDRLFSFNFIVNNYDGVNREVWYLAPGINTSSKSSAGNLLCWYRGGGAKMIAVPDEPAFWKEASGRIFLTGMEAAVPGRADFALRDTAGREVRFSETIPAVKRDEVVRILYRQEAGKLANGPVTLSFDARKCEQTLLKRNVKQELIHRTRTAREELRKLAAERDRLGTEWKNSNYLSIYFYEIGRHLGFLERDLSRKASGAEEEYYLQLCEVEMTGVEESVARLRELLKEDRGDSWRYAGGPARCRNGFFTAAAVNERGERMERPLFFAGFGHFQDVIRDLPVMNRIGANLIQIEIGPSYLFQPPEPGQGALENITLERYRSRVEKAMREAVAQKVKIALLISPHYPFGYYVNRDRANTHDLHGRYVYYQRGNRRMLEAYVRALFAELAKSPYRDAVQSIVLTNEPNMKSLTMDSCFLMPEFEQYLRDRFGSLDDYNKLTGKNYADAAALLASGEQDPAARYAFHCFKRDFFAEWHRWFGDLVREAWPGIPTSAKVMALHNYLPATYGDAIDLELLGEVTEINGNDNFCYYDSARWGSGWNRLAMSCDVQYTLRKNAVANTENHVIPDGAKAAVPPRHIYTATMQQFLHGTGTIASWVWADLDYSAYSKLKRPDLKGGFFRRPSAILAQSEALLDANRVAADIIAFNEAPEQVGILYSPTNIIYNINEASAPTEELYTLLNFCGRKVGFLSERKVAAGEFRDYKVLFLPAVWNIDRKAAEKLADFVRRGGRIYTWRGAPRKDEFNRAFDVPFHYTALPEKLAEVDFYRHLEKALAVIPRKAPARVIHGTGNIGVVTREAATADGVTYLNLTNYNREPRTVELQFSAVELLSNRKLAGRVELAPLKVLFLKKE